MGCQVPESQPGDSSVVLFCFLETCDSKSGVEDELDARDGCGVQRKNSGAAWSTGKCESEPDHRRNPSAAFH